MEDKKGADGLIDQWFNCSTAQFFNILKCFSDRISEMISEVHFAFFVVVQEIVDGEVKRGRYNIARETGSVG